MQLGGVNIDLPKQHGAQVGEASLQLCVVNPCGESGGLVVTQQSMTWINSSMLGVEAAPLPYQIGGGPGTAVTINGRSARLWTNSQGATVYFVYGKAVVTISAAGAEYKALGGSGFLAFCRSLAFLGANPADWTTDVIGG